MDLDDGWMMDGVSVGFGFALARSLIPGVSITSTISLFSLGSRNELS